MADPVDDEIPPYRIPKSLHTARVIPALVTDWTDLEEITTSDHWDIISAARGEDTIRLALSATVIALESGIPLTYTGSYNSDSVAGARTSLIVEAFVRNVWHGNFTGGVNDTATFDLLADLRTPSYRIRAAGYLNQTVTSPTPVNRQVRFSFNHADIIAATIFDFVSDFNFFGATIPFVAFDTGTPGDGTVTAAAITESVL